jgi:hypothetical protein
MKIRHVPALASLSALALLAACNQSKPEGGGNVGLRDMEVVDGTANDSMVDLDNAGVAAALINNAAIPPMPGGASTAAGNTAAPHKAKASTTAAPDSEAPVQTPSTSGSPKPKKPTDNAPD